MNFRDFRCCFNKSAMECRFGAPQHLVVPSSEFLQLHFEAEIKYENKELNINSMMTILLIFVTCLLRLSMTIYICLFKESKSGKEIIYFTMLTYSSHVLDTELNPGSSIIMSTTN